jgi:hypothetical protein
MCAEATVTNRDWKEIENELNGLVPGLPQGERRVSPKHGVRQAIQADEEALLAHIADALVQEEQY